MPIELNDLETNRFGVVAAHLVDTEAELDPVGAAAEQHGVQMLTARIDVGDLATVRRLEGFGFRLMDTLVYYGRSVQQRPAVDTPNGTVIRSARPDDVEAVGAIARAAFTDYMGHYHADPRLDDRAADAAYVEWAETSTAGVRADRPVLLSCEGDRVLGFLTLRDIGEPTAEIVLNAVDPADQGRGLYAALVREAMHRAANAGSVRLIVSTQINNYGVQRVWSRLGLVHERSIYTLHKWFDRDAPPKKA